MAPRPRPKAPFVVTVALAAATGACGGSVSQDLGSAGSGGSAGTGGTGGTHNPPPQPPKCPSSKPADGAVCTGPSSCQYTSTDQCGQQTQFDAECANGVWKVTQLNAGGCNPPPPLTDVCPTAEPSAGSFCNVVDTKICDYPAPCCNTEYKCVNYAWQSVPVMCNPPAIACPDTPPEPGMACQTCAPQFQPCTWDGCADGGVYTTATCDNGAWNVSSMICAGAGDAGP